MSADFVNATGLCMCHSDFHTGRMQTAYIALTWKDWETLVRDSRFYMLCVLNPLGLFSICRNAFLSKNSS